MSPTAGQVLLVLGFLGASWFGAIWATGQWNDGLWLAVGIGAVIGAIGGFRR